MAIVILRQLIKFFIMAGAGFLAVKLKILTEKGLSGIAALVINITMPLMILTTILNGASPEQVKQVLIIIPIGIVLVALLFGISVLVTKLCGVKGNKKRVFRACATMGNNGFMGIPLAVALFPQLGALYSAVFTLVDQTASWTLGYYLYLPEEKLRETKLTANLKKVINPNIIAIIIALIMLMTRLRLPELLNDTLTTIGSVTSPLAMIYIGGTAAGLSFRQAFSAGELYLLVFSKMLIAPIITFTALHFLRVDPQITIYLTMIAGMPTMASAPMVAKSNGSEGDYAAGAVLMTTLFCILTLPLVMLLTGLIG